MNRLHPSDDGSSPFTRGPTRPRHCALAARQTTDPCFEHFRVVVHWFHPETAMYYRAYILDQGTHPWLSRANLSQRRGSQAEGYSNTRRTRHRSVAGEAAGFHAEAFRQELKPPLQRAGWINRFSVVSCPEGLTDLIPVVANPNATTSKTRPAQIMPRRILSIQGNDVRAS